MTARIAIVGDEDPRLPEHGSINALRATLGSDVQTWWIPTASPQLADLRAFDAVWLAGGAAPQDPAAVQRAVEWATYYRVPVLSPSAPAVEAIGPFVAAARAQAARREAWEASLVASGGGYAVPSAARAEPTAYVHQQRAGRYRPWKPVAALLLMAVLAVVAMTVLVAPFVLMGAVDLGDLESLTLNPYGSLASNLGLAGLIPVTLFVIWVVFRRGHRVLSVTGRIRWGWLGYCLTLLLPLWLIYILGTWGVDGMPVSQRPQEWVGLAIVTLLTTPLQAAGEEVFFRGGVVQSVGAWFSHPVVALVASTLASAALFGAAHGSMDGWILADLAVMTVVACYVTWRTGGLEAAIAIHVVNNLTVMGLGILAGGLAESYIDTETAGSAVTTAVSAVVMVLAGWMVLHVAVRRGIAPPRRGAPALG